MNVELVPDPGPADATAHAALDALRREGFADDRGPDGVSYAWQRAGLADAIRDGVAPERAPARAVVPPPRQRPDLV